MPLGIRNLAVSCLWLHRKSDTAQPFLELTADEDFTRRGPAALNSARDGIQGYWEFGRPTWPTIEIRAEMEIAGGRPGGPIALCRDGISVG